MRAAVVLALFATLALAAPGIAGVLDPPAAFLVSRQQPDGGFAEAGGRSDPGVTAWAVLALAAAGRQPARVERNGLSAADFLADKPFPTTTDLALRILALRALGRPVDELAGRLDTLRRSDGRIGSLLNSTTWGVLALRAAGKPAGATSVRYLLRHQRPSGGWGWVPGGAADSNDTAATIQALRAAGVGGRAVSRGVAYLHRLQNSDGGFALAAGRESDAQSTAWAIQALLAARRSVPASAYRFLARLRRPDGSYRYSRRYVTTPTWVTAQVLLALARKPLPLPLP